MRTKADQEKLFRVSAHIPLRLEFLEPRILLSGATQLAFSPGPTGVLAGSTIAPSVVVDVEDSTGQIVASDHSNVTLQINSGTLNGTLTVAAINGVATFKDLSVPAASAGLHTLTASDGSLTQAVSGTFGVTTAGLAGTWQMYAVDGHGSIITDNHADITGGSFVYNDGASETILGGSYAVNSQGNLTAVYTTSVGGPYTFAGSLNAAHDVIDVVTTPLQSAMNQTVLILNSGAYKTADMAGTWDYETADGTYGAITFNAAGGFVSGTWVDLALEKHGDLAGGGCTLNADGTATFTMKFPVQGSALTVVWTGALNASKDFAAGDRPFNSSVPTAPTLGVLVRAHTGNFTGTPLNGTWNLTADETTGTITFNAFGQITGGVINTDTGSYSILSGMYGISSDGLVNMNFTTTQLPKTTFYFGGYIESGLDALVMDKAGSNSSNNDVLFVLTNPAGAILNGSVAGGTFLNFNPAIPGDKGSVDVKVTNNGQIAAGGTATVSLYLTDSDADTSGGTLLGQLKNQPLTIPIGQSQTFAFSSIQLPANLPAGSYYLRADVSATLTKPAEAPQSFSAFSVPLPVVWEFGAVGNLHNVALNLTASDGTTATFSLSGPGTGTVSPAGDGWDLDVTGSSAASALTIATSKPSHGSSGQITLNDVTVAGPLASFTGAKVSLVGSMNVTGSLSALTLYDLYNDGGITLGGAASGKTSLKFNQVSDESLTSANTIASLSAASWADTDSDPDPITAPGLTSATIKGDLAASLDIGSGGIGSLSISGGSLTGGITDTGALTSLKVTNGSITGDVSAVSIGTFSLSGGSLSGDITDSGALTSLKVTGGDVAGNIGAASIGAVSLTGGSLAGDITDTGALTSLKVTGGNIAGNVSATQEGTTSVTGGNVAGNITSTATALQLGTQKAITSLTISGGNFSGKVTANGNVGTMSVSRSATTGLGGSASGEFALGAGLTSLTLIGGDLSGSLSFAGTLGTLSVKNSGALGGNVLAGTTLSAGTIGKLSAGASFEGLAGAGNAISVTAGTVTTLTVAGVMDYTALTLTNSAPKPNVPALGAMSVGGMMAASQLLASGSVTSVTVGGMTDSVAFAGVDFTKLTETNDVWALPTKLEDFSAQDTISNFTVSGLKSGGQPKNSFINSNIAAYKLGTVSLAYADGSNGGVKFGVACNQYGTLNYRDASGTGYWTNSNPSAKLPGDGEVLVITT